MNAINLFVLCQGMELECYREYQKALTCDIQKKQYKEDEVLTLNNFVNEIISNRNDINMLDDFFFGFSIPQISKEFDLLKIYEDGPIINIELKSSEVSKDKIIYQLKRNRYYLAHLNREIYSYTYVKRETDSIVYYFDGEELIESNIGKIVEMISLPEQCIVKEIESLFTAKDYLISPLNTPEKFISGEYYLTNQQEEIKKNILKNINSNQNIIWGIKGGAGTGKTLLLYDIARTLAETYSVCVVHSGILSSGHDWLNDKLTNFKIIPAKNCKEQVLELYDCILIDESQRLYQSNFDSIIKIFQQQRKKCVFAYDYFQVLSYTEERRNVPEQLQNYSFVKEVTLSEKIRTNKEIASFITNVLNLNKRPRTYMNYEKIEVLFAKDYVDAFTIIKHYTENKGYKCISYTPSRRSSVLDMFGRYENTHHIIGQEFDDVIFCMDNNFRYGEDGVLQGRPHPNPDYIFYKLWFQGVSRSRERLCLLVIENEELFDKILEIKNQFSRG